MPDLALYMIHPVELGRGADSAPFRPAARTRGQIIATLGLILADSQSTERAKFPRTK